MQRLVEAREGRDSVFERAGEGGGGRQGFLCCCAAEVVKHHRRRLSALRFGRREAHALTARTVDLLWPLQRLRSIFRP